MAKLDATVAEHPDKSLDELVDQKLINLDQKAQALKKPSLQAAAAQIEEQIGHFRSYAAYYEALIEKQKSDARESLNKELEKVRNEVETATRDKCEQEFTARLLTLSQFLCAAARMRQVGEAASNESRAFEGVLLQVYSGTDDAVKSMMKLINGVDENVRSVEGDEVEITCKSNLFCVLATFRRPMDHIMLTRGHTQMASSSPLPRRLLPSHRSTLRFRELQSLK